MRGLVFDKSVYLSNDLSLPVRAAGEALIKVLLAGICQTDLEITKGYMEFQGILGHEFIGIVEDTSTTALTGKRVTGEINCGCGSCEYCLSGMDNHCPSRKVLGISGKHGAFAEYLVLPEKNLHLIPDAVSDEAAVFIEPLAACYRILDQVTIRQDQAIAVLGDGRIGLLCAQVLRTISSAVTLIGKHPEKMSLLQGRDIETRLTHACNGKQYDLVVDCTGSPQGICSAVELVKPRGTIILKTTTAEDRPLDLNAIVINEVTVLGSRCGPFTRAISALHNQEITVTNLITKIFPLSQAMEALALAADKGTVKVLLRI